MTYITFGTPLYRYDRIGSTQDVAREWAEKGAPPGTVVTAREMHSARGRLGRVWAHPPGANAALTLLAPALPASDVWQAALVAGLAVCRAANAVSPGARAEIRFPNDVYCGTRKLAGVLVETYSHPHGRVTPLVGIGINVVQSPLPPEVAARAVSLEEAGGGQPVSVADVETALLRWLTVYWEQWRQEGFAALLSAWHEMLNRDARRAFVLDGEARQCRVLVLASDGTVSLEADDGTVHTVSAAQILLGD